MKPILPLTIIFFMSFCTTNKPLSQSPAADTFYVDLAQINGSLQDCLEVKMMQKVSTLDKVIKNDTLNRILFDSLPRGTSDSHDIHYFAKYDSRKKAYKTGTKCIKLYIKDTSYSIEIWKKDGNNWRRILNAGSFKLRHRNGYDFSPQSFDIDEICDQMALSAVKLTFKFK